MPNLMLGIDPYSSKSYCCLKVAAAAATTALLYLLLLLVTHVRVFIINIIIMCTSPYY